MLNAVVLAVLVVLVGWCEFCLRRLARNNRAVKDDSPGDRLATHP